MSRSSNTIHTSDISITPIKLKYLATYPSSSFSQYCISVFSGSNDAISNQGSVPQSTLNYYSIKQLFYSNYLTGSFLTTTSSFDNSLQSTAASGTFEADVRIFPTESNANISAISIPRSLFGENIARNSYILSSSIYKLIDDGNGNIIDSLASNTHVGNIIYSQGLAIITNSSYQGKYNNSTASFIAESTIYQNEIRCHINENDFNYSQNPTMLKNGNVITGSNAYPYFTPKGGVARIGLPIDGTLADNVTGSDFRPYATTIGLFNETGDLLVVGKLATPYPIPSNSDMTFIIRYDS